MTPRTERVEIGGRTYTARQLTLAEVVNQLESPASALEGMEVVDLMLLTDEQMTLTDILLISDAGKDDLIEMGEDDIAALARACKAVNPRFFQMRASLHQIGLAAMPEPSESTPQPA